MDPSSLNEDSSDEGEDDSISEQGSDGQFLSQLSEEYSSGSGQESQAEHDYEEEYESAQEYGIEDDYRGEWAEAQWVVYKPTWEFRV